MIWVFVVCWVEVRWQDEQRSRHVGSCRGGGKKRVFLRESVSKNRRHWGHRWTAHALLAVQCVLMPGFTFSGFTSLEQRRANAASLLSRAWRGTCARRMIALEREQARAQALRAEYDDHKMLEARRLAGAEALFHMHDICYHDIASQCIGDRRRRGDSEL